MPGGIDGLFNIFAVDAETMKYELLHYFYVRKLYLRFALVEPMPDIFISVNAEIDVFVQIIVPEPVLAYYFNLRLYLKVAIGKGLIDTDRLLALAQRYAEFF